MADTATTTYRHSGELSDIAVVVNGQEFNLHKFPLFVRSNFFKNHSLLQQQQKQADGPLAPSVARVSLAGFPGGSRVFSTIADFCYNKEVDVNAENAVEVRAATEYLEMTGAKGTGCCRGGLASLADSVVDEALGRARGRRDPTAPLDMLERAARSGAEHAEKAGLSKKIIESFVENLASHSRAATQDRHPKQPSAVLSEKQQKQLNHLPLSWINEVVKQSARHGLNPAELTRIVQGYIDAQTGWNNNNNNNHDNQDRNEEQNDGQKKPSNLIEIASSILKAENKLEKLAAANEADKPKASNLVTFATDDKENDKEPTQQLVSIMSEMLNKQPSGSSSDKNKEHKEDAAGASDLVQITSEILGKQPQPGNSAAATISATTTGGSKPTQNKADEQQKLNLIKTLLDTLHENHVEPKFSLPWLLNNTHELRKNEAAKETVHKFEKMAKQAFQDAPNTSQLDLKGVPAPAVVHFVQDLAKDENKDHEQQKIADFVDQYINDNPDLDLESGLKLAAAVPKDKRHSHDRLVNGLLKLWEKDQQKSYEYKNKVVSHIDLDKLNEKTLEQVINSEVLPAKQVAEAALKLAAKLRKELEDNHKHQSPVPPRGGHLNDLERHRSPAPSRGGHLNDLERHRSPTKSHHDFSSSYHDSSSSRVNINRNNYDSGYTGSSKPASTAITITPSYTPSKYTTSVPNRSSDRFNSSSRAPTYTPSSSTYTKPYTSSYKSSNHNADLDSAVSFHYHHVEVNPRVEDACRSVDNIIIVEDAAGINESCYFSHTFSNY